MVRIVRVVPEFAHQMHIGERRVAFDIDARRERAILDDQSLARLRVEFSVGTDIARATHRSS